MRLLNKFLISLSVLLLSVLGPLATGNEKILGPEDYAQVYDFLVRNEKILEPEDYAKVHDILLGNGTILEVDDHPKVRVRRNLICALGLEGLIVNVFKSALQDIRKYDPINVGDTEDGFLRSGVFYGLSTLTNRTALNVQCAGEKIVFSTTLRMTDAKIKYKWNRRFLFQFSGSIWTKAKIAQFDIGVTWDVSKGMSFEIDNSEVSKLVGLKFGFTGLGPLNPVVNMIVNMLTWVWSNKITSKISELMKDALTAQINKIALPF